MKLLIEPPTWLGDSVMASGAIKTILQNFSAYEKILIASRVSIELFESQFDTVILNGKNLKTLKKIPKVNLFISFRRSFFSKIINLTKAKKGFSFKSYEGHMVEQYSKYTNEILRPFIPSPLSTLPPSLLFSPQKFNSRIFGINPGASYGSAKRWYPQEFAKVADFLGEFGDVVIFGGPGEEDIASEIEKNLHIKNYQNLCGKLSIKELCSHIGGLSGFITNDSGPMHIAAAYGVPVVAIFGPTDSKETSPFSKNYKIITKNLKCSPCKKRVCPIKTHECMKSIKADDVINEVKNFMI